MWELRKQCTRTTFLSFLQKRNRVESVSVRPTLLFFFVSDQKRKTLCILCSRCIKQTHKKTCRHYYSIGCRIVYTIFVQGLRMTASSNHGVGIGNAMSATSLSDICMLKEHVKSIMNVCLSSLALCGNMCSLKTQRKN